VLPRVEKRSSADYFPSQWGKAPPSRALPSFGGRRGGHVKQGSLTLRVYNNLSVKTGGDWIQGIYPGESAAYWSRLLSLGV